MHRQIIDNIKPELDKVVEFLKRELSKIHTGQASPSLVEDVMVDLLGQQMPLKQLAAISSPEPRKILVQPWDKSYIEPIEKALAQSSLGASPVVDKEVIRITLPAPTQELRQGLSRIVAEKAEEARKTVRRWREEAWGEIQARAREGKIREDDKFRGKDELQELVEEYNKKIEEIGERKRKEIMAY